MKKIFGITLVLLSVFAMTACSPKDIVVNGVDAVEGELNNCISLLTDSAYTVTFEKDGDKYVAETSLRLKAFASCDYKTIELVAAITDADEEPLCELVMKSDFSQDRLKKVILEGEGEISVKFVSSDKLSAKETDEIMANGKSIRIISSKCVLNKTPEQIKAEQDSIARAQAPVLEITDFLGPKRSETGWSGKVRDLRDGKDIVASLRSKGFTLDKEYSVRAEEYDGGITQMKCYELSRPVGSMTETVVVHEWPDVYIRIDFCDDTATDDFMAKMTADGYRNGVSSDCYYAGSRVKRSGTNVTLSQIWEP